MIKTISILTAVFSIIIILLVAMLFFTSKYALIPGIKNALFICIPVCCLVIGFMLLKKIYKSWSLPIKLKDWIILIILSIFIIGITLFGLIISSLYSKTDGLFTSYSHKYKFPGITFYAYETSLLGISTELRYSEKNEWISHSIEDIHLSGSADSVKIVQKDTIFMISSPDQKYIFTPVTKKVMNISN